MKDLILERLKQVEIDYGIEILYACESGSRAWGFESTDSDWDVRFIYKHPLDYYITPYNKKDVIELPIKDNLDINGWDLKKALVLLNNSNPPLIEWLHSPIVYYQNNDATAKIKDLATHAYSRASAMYHYYHMARGNYNQYIKARTHIYLKKYLYVLRPILNVHWLDQGLGLPPMKFDVVLNQILPSGKVRDAIDGLLAKKKSGVELGFDAFIPEISDYLEEQVNNFRDQKFTDEFKRSNLMNMTESVFRSILKG